MAGDKEQVQRQLADTVTEAVSSGAVPATACWRVTEFVNGRDVRAPGDRGPARPEDVLRLHPDTVLAAFIETPGGISLVVANREGGEQALLPVDLGAARRRFERRIGGGCLLPRQAASILEPLRELLGALVTELAVRSRPGDHLCLLPSAGLLGLPLHAASLPDGTLLLERNTVGYAPNLAVLRAVLEGGPSVPTGGAGIVAVPKAADRPAFAENLRASAGRLAAALNGAEVLDGLAADKAAVEGMLGSVRQMVVLAHGVNAVEGRGICVSDGTELPPAPLPADTVPELRRFLLDARDIAALPATAETFTTMACSSGRTFAGRGGSRIGLERALFGRGTRTVIAPLWDVDQIPALAFLEYLHGADPAVPVRTRYRDAVLAVRKDHPHPFHWAPFALKGSWL